MLTKQVCRYTAWIFPCNAENNFVLQFHHYKWFLNDTGQEQTENKRIKGEVPMDKACKQELRSRALDAGMEQYL